jgi:hypothetical protein
MYFVLKYLNLIIVFDFNIIYLQNSSFLIKIKNEAGKKIWLN